MEMRWKANWPETKRHFIDWWAHEGLALKLSGSPAGPPHEAIPEPDDPPPGTHYYTAPAWRALVNHHRLSKIRYPGDCLPLSDTMIGPGSLALFLGSEPGFAPTTVWFNPTMQDDPAPEKRPPFRFDPENYWWRITEETVAECAKLAKGKYAVACPDLVENIDILAALRDPQTLLMDMIERPAWIEEKVWEINQVWFEAYSRIYDLIKLDDASSCFPAFDLWGPGKTAKVQCDASAMFSPAMFERFVVPALTEQCDWLDHSMFHLDGHQCLCHLELLLGIESLDAIEWTPDPTVPSGGSPEWYPLYRRILAAGKSVQAIGVKPDEVIPLLDAVGGNGMYIMTSALDQRWIETLIEKTEPYR